MPVIGKLHDFMSAFAQKRRCTIWNIVLFIWLTGAVAADLRTYKIPNRLCIGMAGSGIVLQGYFFGSRGLLSAGAGMLIPFVVLFALFWIRMIGAGDIKLLCAVGTYAGKDIWDILLYVCVAAGGVALAKKICVERKKRTLQSLETSVDEAAKTWRFTRMHMSVPIALGCVWYVMKGWLYGL